MRPRRPPAVSRQPQRFQPLFPPPPPAACAARRPPVAPPAPSASSAPSPVLPPTPGSPPVRRSARAPALVRLRAVPSAAAARPHVSDALVATPAPAPASPIAH
eukprot:3546937-Prymnesium_polylepis.1